MLLFVLSRPLTSLLGILASSSSSQGRHPYRDDSPANLETASPHRYIACYKPALMLCSLLSDEERSVRKARVERSTLDDFGFNEEKDLHIVGRLDRNSEGLLLLTTDGQFTHTVLESRQCHKRYLALIQGDPSESALQEMRRGGLEIRGYQTRPPVDVSRLVSPQDDDMLASLPAAALGMDRQGTWISVVLNEGRNKQVRRMTAAVGHPTIRLVRMAIGALSVGDMQPGEWRYIEKQHVVTDAD